MHGPEHISQDKMRELLREAYSQDLEKSFLGQLARRLRDPAMPRDANNHPRVHPLWLVLALIVVFAVAVLAYFTFLNS